MRKSKQEAAQTRERIVTAAAEEFRQHGIVATGLSDLMSAAGLTHGGFYRHFESKDQLVTEASAAALTKMLDDLASAAAGKRGRTGLKAVTAKYLSIEHRDHPREGCPLAALGSELARADAETRIAATAGFLRLVDIIASQLDRTQPAEAKKRAIVAAATMIGALIMSRIVTDEAISKTLLRNAEESLMSSRRKAGPCGLRRGGPMFTASDRAVGHPRQSERHRTDTIACTPSNI